MFNSFKGAYTFQLQPSSLDTFLAIITFRHPNVSTSFTMSQFNITVSPNPAAAADASTTTGSMATANQVVLFNPMVDPKLVFNIILPYLDATTYTGGQSKLLADFNSIVATNAALDGPAWVESSISNSMPVTILATVSNRGNPIAWFTTCAVPV